MKSYYVDTDEKKDDVHMVHHFYCLDLPPARIYVGDFSDGTLAVVAARRYYRQPAPCRLCIPKQPHEL